VVVQTLSSELLLPLLGLARSRPRAIPALGGPGHTGPEARPQLESRRCLLPSSSVPIYCRPSKLCQLSCACCQLLSQIVGPQSVRRWPPEPVFIQSAVFTSPTDPPSLLLLSAPRPCCGQAPPPVPTFLRHTAPAPGSSPGARCPVLPNQSRKFPSLSIEQQVNLFSLL